MASNSNTDFLRFSAYSFKDVITRKLSEDSNFTDQIYEGSNLAILIDLCAYLYQCLVYQLNSAAAESMFSDTQLYENINRLVKLIGYNPRGCSPSEIVIYIDNSQNQLEGYCILPFSYIDTGLTDSNGKSICFSTGCATAPDGSYSDYQIDYINSESRHKVRLYNGRWKMYSRVLTSGGVENETFILEGVKSDSAAGQYVAYRHIKVFVEKPDGSIERNWYPDADGIFTGISRNLNNTSPDTTSFQKVYNNQEPVYSVRLNENKIYEITFGDGVVGKRLSAGDKLYIFYLDTNGTDGNIDLLDISQQKMKIKNSAADFGISQTLYNRLVRGSSDKVIDDSVDCQYSFGDTVIKAVLEEDTDDIRGNAPRWFSTGNRLITKADYEYWVKNNYTGVVDVKCMNNWQYLTTFYRWLYEHGSKYHSDPMYYLDKDKITRYNYKFADAADANNIYLWVRTDHSILSFQQHIQEQCRNIKTMTTEIEVMEPVPVQFCICAAPESEVVNLYPAAASSAQYFGKNENDEYDSYIEITLDDNVMYVNSDLKDAIASIFRKYFSDVNCSIGQLVDFSDILYEIYGINGVANVRTIFAPNGDNLAARIVNGLSFASWSGSMLDYGDDIHVSNISRQLEDFQFPVMSAIEPSQIKIIKKQLTNINTIKY